MKMGMNANERAAHFQIDRHFLQARDKNSRILVKKRGNQRAFHAGFEA